MIYQTTKLDNWVKEYEDEDANTPAMRQDVRVTIFTDIYDLGAMDGFQTGADYGNSKKIYQVGMGKEIIIIVRAKTPTQAIKLLEELQR